MKQKTTNLDVDELKLSKKRRQPTRMEEFLSGKTAPEYTSDVIPTIAEDISNPQFVSLRL